MVKIEHFGSLRIVLIALTKQFCQAGYNQEESYHAMSKL
jgi:hypothetical protein